MDCPPPPLTLIEDDPAAADPARQKIAPKSRFSRLFSLPNLRSSSSPNLRRISSASSPNKEETPAIVIDSTPITLDSSALIGEDVLTDRYEWAVLYENQRGSVSPVHFSCLSISIYIHRLTVFSIPYYSSLSLLPSDPSPFTLPNASLKRSKQPPVSLDCYPLPDGNWHWVSRCWMIDMRSDTGEVQHDGFEYNWMFRRHHWRAHIGSFNAGGWVRRRRWVRLMVCPAKQKSQEAEGSGASIGSRSSFPPSIHTQRTDTTDDWAQIVPDEVWLGDPEADWKRCRSLMKGFGRDGRKLELWKLWLGFYHPEHKEKFIDPNEKGKKREKQWTEDEGPLPSEVVAADILSKEHVSIAPRDHVIAVLRIHVCSYSCFQIFPSLTTLFCSANTFSTFMFSRNRAFSF